MTTTTKEKQGLFARACAVVLGTAAAPSPEEAQSAVELAARAAEEAATIEREMMQRLKHAAGRVRDATTSLEAAETTFDGSDTGVNGRAVLDAREAATLAEFLRGKAESRHREAKLLHDQAAAALDAARLEERKAGLRRAASLDVLRARLEPKIAIVLTAEQLLREHLSEMERAYAESTAASAELRALGEDVQDVDARHLVIGLHVARAEHGDPSALRELVRSLMPASLGEKTPWPWEHDRARGKPPQLSTAFLRGFTEYFPRRLSGPATDEELRSAREDAAIVMATPTEAGWIARVRDARAARGDEAEVARRKGIAWQAERDREREAKLNAPPREGKQIVTATGGLAWRDKAPERTEARETTTGEPYPIS